ncbi:hypothetical protein QJQ45_022848, partial [Haematococcus lacustris]
RIVKLYAKAARAQLGWSGEEAQLFIKMACGYGINAQRSELKAATLDKGHVADLIEEANKHRRLLGVKKQGSLQDTLPLPCRMHHAVHQLGLTKEPRAAFTSEPALSQHWARWFNTKKLRNKGFAFERGIAETCEFLFDPDTQIGVGIDPGVTQAVIIASGMWDPQSGQLMADQLRRWKLTKGQLEEDMAELSMKHHKRAKQLVVFFGAASIGTTGGWGADAVLRACRKVVCRPRGTDQLWGRVVLVDEHRTTQVSSAVNGKQPCEVELNTLSATRPAGWKPPAGQVEPRLVRPAWSQERDQPVRGMMWCPVVPPRKPPQAPRSSQAATQPAASELGPNTPPPAKRSKPAAEPTKGKGKGKALNMQRIGESRWRPLELCYWPDQGALPAKGKEYPGLGYKRVRDKPPKAQEQQQQQPAEAQ